MKIARRPHCYFGQDAYILHCTQYLRFFSCFKNPFTLVMRTFTRWMSKSEYDHKTALKDDHHTLSKIRQHTLTVIGLTNDLCIHPGFHFLVQNFTCRIWHFSGLSSRMLDKGRYIHFALHTKQLCCLGLGFSKRKRAFTYIIYNIEKPHIAEFFVNSQLWVKDTFSDPTLLLWALDVWCVHTLHSTQSLGSLTRCTHEDLVLQGTSPATVGLVSSWTIIAILGMRHTFRIVHKIANFAALRYLAIFPRWYLTKS